jgi:hypothetical protein
MFMRIRWFLIGSVFSLGIVAGVFVAFGQTDSSIGSFQPFVVDVHQSVPIQVSIPISNTVAPTLTVPLTVGISLRVNIEGPNQAVVEPLSTSPAEVMIATTTPPPIARNEAMFNDIVWTVVRAKNFGSAADLSEYGYTGIWESSGEFIVVDFSLENIGKLPFDGDEDLRGFDVRLVDDKSRLFETHLPSKCRDVNLNPGFSESCFIVFEVAKDATILKVRLSQYQQVTEIEMEVD